jgi:ubiquinone/menaquinone biosynthesis C-methylase UbiE
MVQQEQYQLAVGTAENYERNLVPVMFAPMAERLLDSVELRPEDHVLDVACGTGIVARCAARRLDNGGRVVGLDLNARMLDVARSVSASEGLAIEWYEGSALALPFAEGSFDVVFCQQALQFFPDRPAALQEMHRTLTTNGRLAASVFRSIEFRPELAALAEALERHVSREAAAALRCVVALGDAGELEQLITAGGFQMIEARSVAMTHCHASIEEYLWRMESSSPSTYSLERLEEPTRRAIIADLSAALQPYMVGNALVLPMAIYLITARK